MLRVTNPILSTLFQNPEKAEIAQQLIHQSSAFGGVLGSVYEPLPHINLFQQCLTHANELGVPWWCAISGATFGYRLATWKFQTAALIVQRNRRIDLTEYEPARLAIAESFARRDFELARQQLKEYTEVMKKVGLTGMPRETGALLGLNTVWFVTLFGAVRGMVAYPEWFPSFGLDSGFLWMQSIAIPDPLGVFPVLSTAAFLAATESREEFKVHPQAEKMKWVLRGASFAALPLCSQLPPAFYVYMASNAVFNALFSVWCKRYLR